MRWIIPGIILALAISGMTQSASAQGMTWPEGKHAAIVLTYDDGLPSQLDVAIPQLDRAGLRATFFLNDVKPENIDRWRDAQSASHHRRALARCPDQLSRAREYPSIARSSARNAFQLASAFDRRRTMS